MYRDVHKASQVYDGRKAARTRKRREEKEAERKKKEKRQPRQRRDEHQIEDEEGEAERPMGLAGHEAGTPDQARGLRPRKERATYSHTRLASA